MMKIHYIFCIVLLFSLHACNARPLGFGARVSDLKPVPISRKELRSSSRSDHQSTTHHYRVGVMFWAKMEETNNNSHDGETQVLKFEGTDGETHVEDASDQPKQDTYQEIRESKKKGGEGRSSLQFLARDGEDVEEKVDSKEHETPEDVISMDYSQPQRKPPIHNNKKP